MKPQNQPGYCIVKSKVQIEDNEISRNDDYVTRQTKTVERYSVHKSDKLNQSGTGEWASDYIPGVSFWSQPIVDAYLSESDAIAVCDQLNAQAKEFESTKKTALIPDCGGFDSSGGMGSDEGFMHR